MGTMIVAMQKGIARGIFSNEAGLGSAPIAAAAAQTKEPVRQGLVTMTGTFIDTIVICTMTGLSIVLAGRNRTAVMIYRWLYILAIFIGPYMTVAAVWNIADIFNALMALPNLIALIALRNVISDETKDFIKRHNI